MNMVDLLNTIRDNASDTYRARIPEATVDNMESIRYAMIDSNNIMVANEFMSTLLNKLVKSVVHTKLFTNPLKGLKKGTKPLGDAIEEIYTNFLKGEEFDSTGANLLQRKLPDTKTVYHRMNYKNKYKITVSREILSKAFMSYDALNSYITSTINSLYNSAELDEFINVKQLIKSALDQNALKVVNVPAINSQDNGKEFIKTVKKTSDLMIFPSTQFNSYLSAQNVDEVPITTFSRKDEQILIIDVDTNVNTNIDVLASLFNMSVAEFNDTRKIIIDAFPEKGVIGCLVDEQFFQIYDDLYEMGAFNNPEGLYTNYILHVWQTLAYSILVNGVVFKVASDADDDGKVEEYTVTKTLKAGVTATNKRVKVSEGASYSTILNGVEDGDTVTVTVGSTDVTTTAYDSTESKVAIASVTGNITITVA